MVSSVQYNGLVIWRDQPFYCALSVNFSFDHQDYEIFNGVIDFSWSMISWNLSGHRPLYRVLHDIAATGASLDPVIRFRCTHVSSGISIQPLALQSKRNTCPMLGLMWPLTISNLLLNPARFCLTKTFAKNWSLMKPNFWVDDTSAPYLSAKTLLDLPQTVQDRHGIVNPQIQLIAFQQHVFHDFWYRFMKFHHSCIAKLKPELCKMLWFVGTAFYPNWVERIYS